MALEMSAEACFGFALRSSGESAATWERRLVLVIPEGAGFVKTVSAVRPTRSGPFVR